MTLLPIILKNWLPIIIWAIIIFLFSANPDPYSLLPDTWRTLRPLPQVTDSSLTEFIGVIMHFIEYAVLAFLLTRAIRRTPWHAQWVNAFSGETHRKPSSQKINLFTFITAMIYALSDEIHQLFVPGRTFQLIDLLIDLLGILVGIILFNKFMKRKEIPYRRTPK